MQHRGPLVLQLTFYTNLTELLLFFYFVFVCILSVYVTFFHVCVLFYLCILCH